MNTWPALFVGFAVFGAMGIGCSSTSDSPPAAPKLRGMYAAASPGAMTAMAFDESAHYVVWRSPCGGGGDGDDADQRPCRERGSYRLDESLTELTLTNAETGVATPMPFKVTNVANTLGAQGANTDPTAHLATRLTTQQGGPLVGADGGTLTPGDGGALTNPGDPLIQGFEAGRQLFAGQCSGPEGPRSTSLVGDPPRCANRPVRINGQLLADDARGHWCEYGSCGRSGEATCRTVEETPKADTFAVCDTGAIKCRRCTVRRVECGSTQGCVDHDACYDRAIQANDQGSWALTWAFRQCDLSVAQQYEMAEWQEWMNGRPGPRGFDRQLPYQEETGCQVTDGACE